MTDVPLISHSGDEPAATATAAGGQSKRSRRVGRQWPHSPHAPRFRVATVVLCGLALVAVVAAIAVASQGRDSSSSSAQQWSLWKPTDGGNQGAREIADYLAPTYRISAANQLDVITVVNLESQAAQQAAAQAQANGTTASAQSGLQVAVRPSLSSSQVRLLGGNTIAYNLCGIGAKNCSIGTGKPSSDRLLLLRREALELALYTFKYLGETDNVLAVLPPGHTQATSTLSRKLPTSDASPTKPVNIAVLFQRQELAPLLDHPLALILPEQEPPTVAQMPKAPEAGLVAQATARGLFSEQLQQAQDGSSLMVLAPLPAQ
jgi:hypothetical protein